MSNAAFHWARKLVLPNSYFRVGSQGDRRIPSFPFGNATCPTYWNDTSYWETRMKLVNTSFRAQWNAA